MTNHPSKWALHLLRWFCREDYLDEIEGDLIELFEKQNPVSSARANLQLYWNVVRSFRSRNLKSFKYFKSSNFSVMVSHYLKIGWRNIRGHRTYSKLNIFGLAIGFACCLLIYLWVNDEKSIDHQHANSDRIYNVFSRSLYEGGMNTQRNTPARLPAELLQNIPEIESATGFATSFRLSLKGVTQETFEAGDVILKMAGSRGSPDFFKVFTFPLLEGSAEEALKEINNIAISRKMAEIFFGDPEQAIGKTIRYQNSQELKVAAVFENLDSQSSLKFDYLTNWESWVNSDEIKQSWGHFGTQTYVKLAAAANPELVQEKIVDFLDTYLDFDESFKIELDLQPFEDQYLYGDFENGMPTAGRQVYVSAFQGVAVFILIIAILNFINLVTATAARRAKEVGVRKTVGAYGFTLKSQFLAETFLMTSLAIIMSMIFAMIALPVFNELTQKTVSIPFADFSFWLAILGLISLVSFLAGAYPAFVLSKTNLISIQNQESGVTLRSVLIRKGLVVFQFFLSILLIIATVVVTRQTHYIRKMEVGFNKSNLVYLPLEGELVENYGLFRTMASAMPGVVMVDRSSQVPHDMGFSGPFANWEGKNPDEETAIAPSSVGFEFIDLMELEVVEGRGFSRDIVSDQNNFVINEAAQKLIGTDAIGTSIRLFGKQGVVVGVVKDFHFNSLHTRIKPLFLDVKEDLNFATVLVRIEEGNTVLGLQSIRKAYETINPGYAFNYTFAEDVYSEMYSMESTTTKLTQYFAGLAIFITCLGLFGLVAHATEKRIKEIGIRKVLGASVLNILNLVSKDFAVLLVVAAILAIPLAYKLMGRWLSDFAYRIDLTWGLFAIACSAVILISYLIIWSRVMKSARANPVNSLRIE